MHKSGTTNGLTIVIILFWQLRIVLYIFIMFSIHICSNQRSKLVIIVAVDDQAVAEVNGIFRKSYGSEQIR